jgi:hypothetical protein
VGRRLLPALILLTLVILTLASCGGGSSTPSTLTTVSAIDGDVSVMGAGTNTWTEAEVGMSVEDGDFIKTGDDSSAEITFFDGSTIELQPGTEVEIASLDIADSGSTTISLEQTIGATISRVVNIIDPQSSYEVETATGAAAVRWSASPKRAQAG